MSRQHGIAGFRKQMYDSTGLLWFDIDTALSRSVEFAINANLSRTSVQ